MLFFKSTLGPGYYEKGEIPCRMLQRSPSWSSKGYNTFVSKTDKLLDTNIYKYALPGPGYYEIEQKPPSSTSNGPECFGSRQMGRVPFPPGPTTPGPLDYHINYGHGNPKLLATKKSATFTSQTSRDSFLVCQRLLFIFMGEIVSAPSCF